MKNQEMDELFRKGLGKEAFPIPPGALDAIGGLLDQRAGKRKRFFFFWFFLGLLLLAGGLFAGIIYVPNFGSNPTAAETVSSASQSEEEKLGTSSSKKSDSTSQANPDHGFTATTKKKDSRFKSDFTVRKSSSSEFLAEKTAKNDHDIKKPSSSSIKNHPKIPADLTAQGSQKDSVEVIKKHKKVTSHLTVYDNTAEDRLPLPLPKEKDNDSKGFSPEERKQDVITKMPFLPLPAFETFGTLATRAEEAEPADLYKLSPHSWGLIFGGEVVSTSPSSTESGSSSLFQPVIGIRYRYQLGRAISLNLAPSIQSTSAFNASRSFNSEDYGFGRNTHFTTIQSNRLFNLEMPIFVRYQWGAHGFMAGLQGHYLLNSLSQVDQLNEAYPKESAPVQTNSKQFGYFNGFQRLDGGFMVGYAFYLSTKTSLGLTYHHGLIDLTKNDYYNNERSDFNRQVRLVVDYQIFKQ